MVWQARRADVEYFVAELWKDRRDFPSPPEHDRFAKDCFTVANAELEVETLDHISSLLGPAAVPRVLGRRGSVVSMERVPGVRVFDLVRHLKAADNQEKARAALHVVMSRTGARLAEVQVALLSLDVCKSQLEPYPLKVKVDSLLRLFIRVLDIRHTDIAWESDVASLSDYWVDHCAVVPFRDATTKNMFLDLPDIGSNWSDDMESNQANVIEKILADQPLDVWESCRLADVDFSSVNHSTAPEDDPLSLYFHEWTYGLRNAIPESLILDPRLGLPSPERAASAALVRYLRFGGRKLAYKLLNAQGYNIRFAYDDPLFYFREIPSLCDELCPSFGEKYPDLFVLISRILDGYTGGTQADKELLRVDQLRRFSIHGSYWQQSPLETF